MVTSRVETLADYYYRNMTYENLKAMEHKGPSWKQLQDYKVSHLEWYEAVNLALLKCLGGKNGINPKKTL